MCFRISTACEMTAILTLALGTGVSTAETFVPEFLDSPSSVTWTQYTDIDIDAAGAPHVAYTGEGVGGNARLWYAWKSGGLWQDDYYVVGPYINFCAMDLDGNGDAHFAVQGNSSPDWLLVYYHYSGGAWSVEIPELPNVVAGDTLVGDWPDIVVDASFVPWISYQWKHDYAAAEGDLRMAFKSGATWIIETVDGGPDDVGEYTSITLSNQGRPRIAYYDRTNGNLMYARRSEVGSWTLELVDDLPDVGTWTDIAVGPDGDVHISYVNEVTRALRYARRSGGAWATEAIPDNHTTGDGTSIAVDANGDPHIAYYHMSSDRLRHCWKHDGVWDVEHVDSTGDRGWRPALVLDADDVPHLSYMEEPTHDVYYATYDLGVDVQDGTPALVHSLRVFPNPVVGGVPVRVEYAAMTAAGKTTDVGPADLSVYDLSGRRVRTLLSGGTASGTLQWDGRTDRGTLAAAGTYIVRLEQGGAVVSRRIQVVR